MTNVLDDFERNPVKARIRDHLAETSGSLEETGIRMQQLDLLADCDPRMQLALEKRRRGLTPAATASTERGEMAVTPN